MKARSPPTRPEPPQRSSDARTGTSQRRQAERRGRLAERLCLWHLRLRGWRILAQDWRSPVGEIDILARRGGVLAIIEVKSRPSREQALAALSPKQRRRIARAAQAYLSTRPELGHLTPRFDLMLTARRSWPRHLTAAWRVDE